MLKISWTEKVTNEEVLVRANEAGSILKTIWCRKYRVGQKTGLFFESSKLPYMLT